ncbi:MFS family permease [Paenibacillus shirakamiensis]|uniref:MFS family permease n=1 Tax=Paenibacillus shirakamiensis TaxID=1265935 RepID=A0ABS4JI41_9BACL|nr:MFS transporter [Paenibacillus shirakamiensis]MBP2000219.1 MFS family permease [Paenibacillus shirakamiensis]
MRILHTPHIQLLKTHHNLMLSFFGMLISRLGDGIYSVAIIAIAFELTHSSSGTGIVLASFAAANVIFGSLAGVFSDRFQRQKLMIGSSCGCGVILIGMGLLLYYDLLNIINFAILSFILGACSQFFEPTLHALLPQFVKKEDLTTANATIGMTESIGYLVGPALGGILLAYTSVEFVLILNACTFLFAMFMALFLKIPKREKLGNNSSSFIREVMKGFSFVFQDRFLLRLFIINSISILAYSPFFVLLPAYLDHEIGLDVSQRLELTGYIYSALALGQFVGFGLLPYLKITPRSSIGLSYLIQAIGFGSLAFAHHQGVVIGFVFIAGISFGISGAAFNTVLQSGTPSTLMGRVYGVNYTVQGMLNTLGRSSSGFLAESLGSRVLLMIMGGLFLTSSFLSRRYPKEPSLEEHNISG